MINWSIDALWVKPTEGDLTNVVVTAAWRCSGTETSGGKEYSGTTFSTVSFSPPDPSAFIEYADLTLNEVLQWCWTSGVDRAVTEAAVQQQIQQAINPPIITPPLPWANTGNQP